MRLQEWKDSNGNKVSTPSGASTPSTSGTSSSGSFKKRLNKLINYYGQHHPAEVEFITVNLLTNDTLDFTEYYDDRSAVRYNIYIGPTTEAWRLKISMNNKIKDDIAGTGWVNLLRDLRPYITIPVVSTPEYKNLFTEWLDAKGNKISHSTSTAPTKTSSTSSGYKKRFEKLIKYHIDHASSELESITHKDIKDDSFHLGEHYNTGKSEFDREIKVSYNIKNNTFTFSIRVDNILVENKTVDSYEKLVERLESYMWLPDEGTPDYDDLLTESLSIADDFKLYENLWD